MNTKPNQTQPGHFPELTKLLLAVAAALALAGCRTTKEELVQNVAKDWCMTIRGSQVIPVYPLTEDIQPGDVFLVQVPADRQQEIYKSKGFLPLDNHLARLNPSGFGPFYVNSFLDTNAAPPAVLPRAWIRPGGVGPYFGTNSSNTLSWLAAPRAAFPSYSFAVESGKGLNLAVPIQGVPVGLSLLASDAASGSIQIRDARTLGVDTLSLYQEIKQWASANASFLRHFGAGTSEKKTNFLRVVTRIYATGRLSVSLKDASNRNAGLDVGAPKPVNLLTTSLPDGTTNSRAAALQNYTNSWSTLSAMVAAATEAKDAAGNILPGGSVRLTAASASTVSLDEVFDPPLVLGYLGFDCAILRGGLLGPPIPTHAVLDSAYDLKRLADQAPIYGVMLDQIFYDLISERADKGDVRAVSIQGQMDQLGMFVPPSYDSFRFVVSSNDTHIEQKQVSAAQERTFATYHQYRSHLRTSTNDLGRALALPTFDLWQISGGKTNVSSVTSGSEPHQQLARVATVYRAQMDRDADDGKMNEVIAGVHHYYLEALLK